MRDRLSRLLRTESRQGVGVVHSSQVLRVRAGEVGVCLYFVFLSRNNAQCLLRQYDMATRSKTD